ncbi:hypothetical protein WJX84_011124, partial [Apatococcus fuscideae]
MLIPTSQTWPSSVDLYGLRKRLAVLGGMQADLQEGDIQAQNLRLLSEVQAAQEQVAGLEAHNQQLRAACQDLEKKLVIAEASHLETRAEADCLRRERAALRADLERAQHATIAAAAPSHAPLEQLALLQAQYEQSTKGMKALHAREVQQLQAELALARRELESSCHRVNRPVTPSTAEDLENLPLEILRAEIGCQGCPDPGLNRHVHSADGQRVDRLRKAYREALVGMRSQQEKALMNVERRHRASMQEVVKCRAAALLHLSVALPTLPPNADLEKAARDVADLVVELQGRCGSLQDLVEKLQTDLTESGMQERLDRVQEEHKALMRAELANHAAAMEASKAASSARHQLLENEVSTLQARLQAQDTGHVGTGADSNGTNVLDQPRPRMGALPRPMPSQHQQPPLHGGSEPRSATSGPGDR